MKILMWFLRISIFSIVLLFAFNNTENVILRFVPGFPELTFTGPLIIWLFLSFLCGILITITILLPNILRNWRVFKRNAN